MSKYRYRATIKQEDGIFTVEFPAFQIKGRGFSDYAQTVEFANDLLAEIILAYRKDSKDLPLMSDPGEPGQSDGEQNEESLLLEVDADQYEKKVNANRKRVFYEFETDEGAGDSSSPGGVRGRAENDRRKIILPIVTAVIVLFVIIVGLISTGR